MKKGGTTTTSSQPRQPLQLLYRTIDVITVALILSGQININGVFFFKNGGFSLSFTGPITGGTRSIALVEEPAVDIGIDTIGLVAALLLILDQINVIGTLLAQGSFTIVVSGPVFGELKRVAYAPEAREFFAAYKEQVVNSLRL